MNRSNTELIAYEVNLSMEFVRMSGGLWIAIADASQAHRYAARHPLLHSHGNHSRSDGSLLIEATS
eukprot:6047990-Amphidinium_carterae.1